MRKLVLFTALVCLAFVYSAPVRANVMSCGSLFSDSVWIEEVEMSVFGNKYQQVELSNAELYTLLTTKFRPESRTIQFHNKIAVSDGQVVTIDVLINPSKKVYQREFDLVSTKGSFEPSTGQYWIMPHNSGRVVIWNYSKDRVIDIPLPEKVELMGLDFDFTSNIFEPTVTVQYRELLPESLIYNIHVSLINGERIDL